MASQRRAGVVNLGWPHYWLLTAILGGILGLIAMVFLVHAASQ